MSFNKSIYLALKGNRKIIAETLLRDIKKYLFMDIEEIAENLNTTPATLSRIVRNIGFSGFRDFRSWAGKKLGFIIETKELAVKKDEKLLEDELNGLKANFSPAVLNKIDEAARLITSKDSIIVASFGIAHVLMELFIGYLELTTLKVKTAKNSFTEALIALNDLGKSTTLFFIDLFLPFKEGLRILESFKEKAIERISLTAVPFSKIEMLSSLVIPVRVDRKYIIPPIAPAVSIIDLLAMKIMATKMDESQKKIKFIEKSWQDKEIFWGN